MEKPHIEKCPTCQSYDLCIECQHARTIYKMSIYHKNPDVQRVINADVPFSQRLDMLAEVLDI